MEGAIKRIQLCKEMKEEKGEPWGIRSKSVRIHSDRGIEWSLCQQHIVSSQL